MTTENQAVPVAQVVGRVDGQCETMFCDNAASHVWYRTDAERKAMAGRTKRQGFTVQPERYACETHIPFWRRDVYLPVGSPRPELAPAPEARRRRKPVEHHCSGCTCLAGRGLLEVA